MAFAGFFFLFEGFTLNLRSGDIYVLIKLACQFLSWHEAILTDGYDYRHAMESRVVFPKGHKSGVKSLLPFWLHI